MPYDSIATQDDRDFQQDAAVAGRLRIIDPSLSRFDQADVADMVRPDMIRLNQMTKMRGELNQMDQQSRSFLRAEDKIGEDASIFDETTKSLRDVSAQDLPSAISQKLRENPSLSQNQQFKDWSGALLGADNNEVTFSRNTLIKKQNQSGLRMFEDTDAALHEAGVIQAKGTLALAKAGFQKIKDDQETGRDMEINDIQTNIGGLDIPDEQKEAIMGHLSTLDTPESAVERNMLGMAVQHLNVTGMLDEASRNKFRSIETTLSRLSNDFKLDFTDPVNLVRLKEIKGAEKPAAIMEDMFLRDQRRNDLAAGFAETLASLRGEKDPEIRKYKIGVATAKITQLSGAIKGDLEYQTRQNSEEDRQIKIENTLARLKIAANSADAAKEYRNLSLQLRQEGDENRRIQTVFTALMKGYPDEEMSQEDRAKKAMEEATKIVRSSDQESTKNSGSFY